MKLWNLDIPARTKNKRCLFTFLLRVYEMHKNFVMKNEKEKRKQLLFFETCCGS